MFTIAGIEYRYTMRSLTNIIANEIAGIHSGLPVLRCLGPMFLGVRLGLFAFVHRSLILNSFGPGLSIRPFYALRWFLPLMSYRLYGSILDLVRSLILLALLDILRGLIFPHLIFIWFGLFDGAFFAILFFFSRLDKMGYQGRRQK